MTTEQIQEALQDLKEHHKTHDVQFATNSPSPHHPPYYSIHIYWWCKSGELKYSNQCYGTSLPALFHEAKVLTKA